MRRSISILFLLLAACGGVPAEDAPEMRIGFQMHALDCEVSGLQARLEATGVEGVCPLQVSSDRRVTGVCSQVPAGGVRNFRLVYYFDLGSGPEPIIELATILATLDLRDQREPTVVLEFPENRLIKNQDDDGDKRTNLEEFCAGTNPRRAD